MTGIDRPHLSAPFRSTTTKTWRVGISTPLFEQHGGVKVFAGVLVLSVDLGDFEFLAVEEQPRHDRFAVLVDARDGTGGGRIILHPYFAEVAPEDPSSPIRTPLRAFIDQTTLARMSHDWRLGYQDPLSKAPGGGIFSGPWIAAVQPMHFPDTTTDAASGKTGVDGMMVVVQERSGAATAPVEQLGSQLVTEAVFALLAIVVTIAALWYFALRGRSSRTGPATSRNAPGGTGPRPLRDRSTLSETGPDRG